MGVSSQAVVQGEDNKDRDRSLDEWVGPSMPKLVFGRTADADLSISITGEEGRTHYRTVMAHVGDPLDEITSLEVSFLALVDIVHCCRLLCLAGYIHGDLSCGNIIVDQGEKHGRLGNWESAKHATSVGDSEQVPRRGIPAFVAVELAQKQYLFPPEFSFKSSSLVTCGIPELPPVRPNAGHELESLLWIAIYLLYSSLVVEPDDLSATALEEDSVVRREADILSRRREEFFDCSNRNVCFVGVGFSMFYCALARDLDRRLRRAVWEIKEMRNVLIGTYQQYEKGLMSADCSPTDAVFSAVYGVFEERLRAIGDLLRGKKTVRIDVVRTRRPESENEPYAS